MFNVCLHILPIRWDQYVYNIYKVKEAEYIKTTVVYF